ncbi:hypothetical protein PALI_b0012 [Pseudoalteromonas aliena SW19]|uniref:Uncharacterized protein n=1 Tax=Pseudoalteromonas aliena SW19 TaxID=1314866 RepID=A0ABR9E3C1_9GAMM|nr:hypothetical protein [Pseudoalteromonas aliena SW19]
MLCGGELLFKELNKTPKLTNVFLIISTTVYANCTLSTYQY